MDIFIVKYDGCQNVIFSINVIAITIFAVATILVYVGVKLLRKKSKFANLQIDEATIGIGNSSITVKYDGRIKKIAYKIWVELTTRKIGVEFDERYDVISEVYDSWYEAFKIIRNLLEEIPDNRINDAKGLIDLTTKVLNCGLRPHLTMWQAKYRMWYKKELESNTALSPQDIQRKYPEYRLLVNDLIKTNNMMIKYAAELKRIIDNNV